MPPLLTVDSVECLQARLGALGLSLKVTQLAGGELRGTLLPLLLGPLRLLRIRVDRSVHCAGPKPRGSQIVAIDLGRDLDGGVTSPAPIRSHGQPLLPRALFGLSGDGEVHLTTFGPCDMALLLIHRQEFLHRADRLGCSVLEQVLPATGSPWIQAGLRGCGATCARSSRRSRPIPPFSRWLVSTSW